MTNLLWVVDAQNDFFDEDYEVWGRASPSRLRFSGRQKPKLAVPGSSSIRAHLGRLVNFTSLHSRGWVVAGSLDAHTPNDAKHFSKWPVHCLKDTPGYFPIQEVDARDRYQQTPTPVPMQKLSMQELAPLISDRQSAAPEYDDILFFEKGERAEDTDPDACNSCRVNPNVAPALQIWKPELIVLCGLALGYCLKEARNYFRELGYPVALVTDAIKEFSAEELALYGKWHAEGDKLLHTADVLAGKCEV